MSNFIYHICRLDEWSVAQVSGSYEGSSQDVEDGFIHFSTAAQVRASAAKHRTGQTGLVLLSVDPDVLGGALRWERSRRGQLFPHLYRSLQVSEVVRADPIDLNYMGDHVFPAHIPET
jgi:Uncharacterized protein conserved in bacteria